jgi:dihydroorotase
VPPQEGALDKLEGFASFHGPAFYGLPRNSGTLTLTRRSWAIPESYGFGGSSVVPMWAGNTIHWQVAE